MYKTISLKRIFAIVALILWLIFIFYLSSMNGEKSNSKSKEIISKDLAVGTKITSKINKQNNNRYVKVTTNNDEKLDELNAIFRKCMHGLVYLVLSIIIIVTLKITEVKGKKIYIIAILGAFLYACTDELHQSFVEGRTSSFIDVLIDTSGAIIGVCSWIMYEKIVKMKKGKNI